MQWHVVGLAFLLASRDLFTLENHAARHVPAVFWGGWSVYGPRALRDRGCDVRRVGETDT